jgi:hypothetical protein
VDLRIERNHPYKGAIIGTVPPDGQKPSPGRGVLAHTAARTSVAPARRSANAHAESVAPVVRTSSTRRIRAPDRFRATRTSPSERRHRSTARNVLRPGPATERRRTARGSKGSRVALETSEARTRPGSNPRRSQALTEDGTPTTASTPRDSRELHTTTASWAPSARRSSTRPSFLARRRNRRAAASYGTVATVPST